MDDMISRRGAIDVVHHTIYEFFDVVEDDNESPMTYKDMKLLELNKSISTRIKGLPSAQRKGKWIYLTGLDAFECSVCGSSMVRNIFNYCPWCGAEMEKGEDNEL